MASFEEQYYEPLRAVETAIITAFAAHPDAKDRHADDALGDVVRTYNAAFKNKRPPRLKHNAIVGAFYANVKAAMEAYTSGTGLDDDSETITVEEAAACVKRIRRSVSQMIAKNAGAQAYLEFVRDYRTNTEG